MKVGDLVKIKFFTNASMCRARMMSNEPVNQIGLVVETAENACKVMFPHRNNEVRSFLKSSLEVISSRVTNEDR